MKAVATIRLKLPYNEILLETMHQYSKSAQEVANWGWELHTSNKRELHDLTYKYIRKITNLPAQLVCSSRNKTCEVLKLSKSKPIFKKYFPIRYDARSFSFKKNEVSLCSIKGRIKISVKIPEYYKQYLSWKVCSADLVLNEKKQLFIHIVFSKQINVDTSSRGNGRIVGIDLGINKLAVVSDNRFFSSRKVKQRKSEFQYLRRKLQKKGTPSAKRFLKKLSGKEKRFMRAINHEVSKAIVETLNAGDIIVMEDIKGVRKERKGRRLNRWLNNWSFYQLQEFIRYKAERKGIEVVKVKARDTSKTCSNCENLETSRHSGFFECNHCGFTLDADLNASRNLAKRYMRNISKVAVNQPYVTSDDAEACYELRQSLVTSHHF
jgi:IS605 OrfB family transposase